MKIYCDCPLRVILVKGIAKTKRIAYKDQLVWEKERWKCKSENL